jgi:hypothetical protein
VLDWENPISLRRKIEAKEKGAENKLVLELIQCAIQFGNASQNGMVMQLHSQNLELLKQCLHDKQMRHDLASLDIKEHGIVGGPRIMKSFQSGESFSPIQ